MTTSSVNFYIFNAIASIIIIIAVIIVLIRSCIILDIIPPPAGFTLVTTKLVLYINWTQPSHQCVSNYTVRTNYSIIVTADEGVDIPLAGLPPTTYCASVAVADIANRTGKYSEEECIELGGILTNNRCHLFVYISNSPL